MEGKKRPGLLVVVRFLTADGWSWLDIFDCRDGWMVVNEVLF